MYPFIKEYLLAKYLRIFRDRLHLEEWQQKQIVKHLEQVLPLSSFYEGFSAKEFSRLPIVDKVIMMENFDSINTLGLKKEEAFKVGLRAKKRASFLRQLIILQSGSLQEHQEIVEFLLQIRKSGLYGPEICWQRCCRTPC
ncbi:MAG: hypothetical protein H0W50_11200 [Parachlamydiaceae bacterium]|nr:hypothetical protein [Parachlamydiaceae bacterium]